MRALTPLLVVLGLLVAGAAPATAAPRQACDPATTTCPPAPPVCDPPTDPPAAGCPAPPLSAERVAALTPYLEASAAAEAPKAKPRAIALQLERCRGLDTSDPLLAAERTACRTELFDDVDEATLLRVLDGCDELETCAGVYAFTARFVRTEARQRRAVNRVAAREVADTACRAALRSSAPDLRSLDQAASLADRLATLIRAGRTPSRALLQQAQRFKPPRTAKRRLKQFRAGCV